ncbi:hypothetical protein [Nonomuraea sp. NPDC049141]|uniref:hypothetical protein n=1 Tax=Nonomuraea sp. NPDC049141 TaxID=3155500 RepID=UPI0033E7D090
MSPLSRWLDRIPEEEIDELRAFAPIGTLVIAVIALGKLLTWWALRDVSGSFGMRMGEFEANAWLAIEVAALAMTMWFMEGYWRDDTPTRDAQIV